MPITKSAKKSLRVSQTRRAQNTKQRIALDKALKNVDAKSVNQTVSLVDKAAKTKIIHANKAARLKSQLAKKFGTPANAKSKVESSKSIKSVTKKPVKKTAKAKK